MKYPDCYLHVEDCRSGQTWIMPITGNKTLDITLRVKEWIKNEFCGELKLDGELMPKLEGEYYAKILTDNRGPDSIVVWDSGGFFLKNILQS